MIVKLCSNTMCSNTSGYTKEETCPVCGSPIREYGFWESRRHINVKQQRIFPARYYGGHILFSVAPRQMCVEGMIYIIDEDALIFTTPNPQSVVRQPGPSWTMKIPFKKIIWGEVRSNVEDMMGIGEKIVQAYWLGFGLQRGATKMVIPYIDANGLRQNPIFEIKQRVQEFSQMFYDILRSLKAQQASKEEKKTAVSTTVDPSEQIKKLSELRDADLITEEEFQAKKKELLAKL